MTKWVGIIVSRKDLRLVELLLSSGSLAEVVEDKMLKLQSGARASAYRKAQEWLVTYLSESQPLGVVIKGSALPGRGGGSIALLEGAEFRGVVMAAAIEAGCEVAVVKKAALSKTFGDRKVDAYVADDDFWSTTFTGPLRKGSREAALIAFSAARDTGAV